jgi:hypothetical protein
MEVSSFLRALPFRTHGIQSPLPFLRAQPASAFFRKGISVETHESTVQVQNETGWKRMAQTSAFSLINPSFLSFLLLAVRAFIVLLSLSVFAGLSGCRTPDLKSESSSTEIELLDHKIAFRLPAGWKVQISARRYFHLAANTGTGPYAPSIEYRGLNTDLTDRALMDQYARGWYNAMATNFPNLQYIEKKEWQHNEHVTYYFEATFSDGKLPLKKIGYLRFVNRKIHAIYYTAPLNDFDRYLPLFQSIENEIRYLN